MRLSVFLRFSTAAKLRVGTLSEVGRDIAFEYDSNFLSTGLNIAPFRLPAKAGVQLYDRSGNMETFDYSAKQELFRRVTLSVAGEGANPTQRDLDRLAKEVGST